MPNPKSQPPECLGLDLGIWTLGFGPWDLGFGIYRGIQVIPPSEVLNVRPSAVVTVALRESEARTADRSAISGKGIRSHDCASVDRQTLPPRPTTQQIPDAGDDPAVSTAPAGIAARQ